MPDFVKVCSVSEIKPNSMKKFTLNGKEILLFNLASNFYAIGAVCTHADGPLEEGTIEGEEIVCPWHAGRFEIKSGKNTAPPPNEPVEKFEVKVEGNEVKIKL